MPKQARTRHPRILRLLMNVVFGPLAIIGVFMLLMLGFSLLSIVASLLAGVFNR